MSVGITVVIPSALRHHAGDQAKVRVEGATVGEALAGLAEKHPQLKAHLFTDEGTARRFVNVYLNSGDIRHLDGLRTPVRAGDEIVLVPAIAGG
jgi:sulfur-carrier protein